MFGSFLTVPLSQYCKGTFGASLTERHDNVLTRNIHVFCKGSSNASGSFLDTTVAALKVMIHGQHFEAVKLCNRGKCGAAFDDCVDKVALTCCLKGAVCRI